MTNNWQVSTAYRARAGQSRTRRQKNRQDQRVMMSALVQVKSELRAEWDALMADLHRVTEKLRASGQIRSNPYLEYGLITADHRQMRERAARMIREGVSTITVTCEEQYEAPVHVIQVRGTVKCD